MQKAVITIHKQIPLLQDTKVQLLNCLVKTNRGGREQKVAF